MEHTIGDYSIIGKPLGSGGMATVYKVKDSKGKIFAAKVLHAHLNTDRKLIQRFKQEYEIGKKLSHPAFVKNHEMFKHAGSWTIIMDFIPGLTLQKVLSKTFPSEQQATAIVAELALALDFFHKAQLVHRDLKPDNIILDDKGKIIIMDYGITRQLSNQMTKTGTAIGTPVYMAPEQIMNSKSTDKRCDLYSIGLIYFRLLTKRDAHGMSSNSDLYAMIEARHKKSVRNIKDLQDQAIRPIIENCLLPNPEQRYDDCQALYQDLTHTKSFSKSRNKVIKSLIADFNTKKTPKTKAKPNAKTTVIRKKQGKDRPKLAIIAISLALITGLAIAAAIYFIGFEELIRISKDALNK